jgi:thioredoxin 1
MNKEEFDKKIEEKDKIFMVDFFATWCGPCQMMTPIIEELESEYKEKVTFLKIDIDENPDISSKYSVMSVPTFLILKDGKEVDKFVGAVPKDAIAEKINEALK